MSVISDETMSQKPITYTDDISGRSIKILPRTHLFRYIDRRSGKSYLYTVTQLFVPDIDSIDIDARWIFYNLERADSGCGTSLATIRYHLLPIRYRKPGKKGEPYTLMNVADSKDWLSNRFSGDIAKLKASKMEYAVKNIIAIDQGLMLVPGQRDFRGQIKHLKNQCNFRHWWQN